MASGELHSVRFMRSQCMALICESSSGSLPITSSLGALKEKLLTVVDCVHETFNHLSAAAFFGSSFSGEGGNQLPNTW